MTLKVAVCSVGVGAHYGDAVHRLDRSLDDVGFTGERILYSGRYPKRCPPHQITPYAFKPWALFIAQLANIDIAFWADSICIAARPLDSLIRYVEQEGVYFNGPDHSTGMWTNDRTLRAFDVTRDEAMEIPMILAGTMGLDLRTAKARTFLRRWLSAAEQGLFNGLHTNAHRTESDDPRCLGHRHDQSVASLLIHEMRLPMTQAHFRFAADTSGEPTWIAKGWP